MTALAPRPPVAPPSRGAWHVLAPLVVALFSAAAVALIYRVFVRSALGQQVDTAALHGAEVGHARAVEIMSRALNSTTLVSLVLVCLAAAAIGVVRRRVDLAVGAALLVLGANLSTQLLKTRLPRPDLDGFPAPNSFPSGHTTAAASVAFALILVLPHAIRGTLALVGAGYVTVIAVATVWAEWHRPSDTIAALLVVLAWAGLVAAVLRLWRIRTTGQLERPNRVTTVLLTTVIAVAGTVGTLGLIAVTVSEVLGRDLVSGRLAFLAGSVAVTAAVAATFVIWVRLAAGVQRGTAQPVPPEADAESGDR